MSNRQQLRFKEEASDAFAYTVEEFGFTQMSASELKVRYESKKVYIEINHGGYDFEVSIAFGRLRQAKPEQFDFTLFLRLVNPAFEKAMGERIADKPGTIRETLLQLAAALRSEGMDIIKGRDAVFERMKTVNWWQFRPEALVPSTPPTP